MGALVALGVAFPWLLLAVVLALGRLEDRVAVSPALHDGQAAAHHQDWVGERRSGNGARRAAA